jgi:phosphate ABC transporter phosphate-binding protein
MTGLTAIGKLTAALLASALLFAQTPAQTSPAHKYRVYLEQFPGPLHDELLNALKKEPRLSIADTAADADWVLTAAGETWVSGHVGSNPRVRYVTGDAQPIYAGYLSVELKNKQGETVWSWLSTPRRFDPHDIRRNLAEQVAPRLVAALAAQAEPASPAAATAHPSERLTAAGATFPWPLYQKWFDAFAGNSPGTAINYSPVGSGAGIEGLRRGEVDFAASDMPLSDDQLATLPVRVRHIPTAVGGVVPIYHVDGVSRDLRFTPEILAGIWLGRIRRWDDPLLRETNRGVALPGRDIAVVHRSDGSGTTFIFTSYLADVSDAWKSGPGRGAIVTWPAGVGASGNEGVAELVQKTPDSIGYVEFIFALQHQLSYGAVRNRAGRFVQADLTTLTNAAVGASFPGADLRVSIVNAPGAHSYAIAAFTYLLVPEKLAVAGKQEALSAFLRWMLTTGQKQCASLGYVALPPRIAERALELIGP